MGKNVVGVLVVGLLILVVFPAGSSNLQTMDGQEGTPVKNTSFSVSFSSRPQLCAQDGFVEVDVTGTTTQMVEPNKPVLPIYVKTFQIPFKSMNVQVLCNPKNIGTMTLTKNVVPGRIVTVSQKSEQTVYVKDASVYGSAAFYPGQWFSYDLGAGRNENDQQVTFVKVVCYAVQYSPVNKQIEYAAGFDIALSYVEPDPQPRASTVSYDMVIIAPSKFESGLQPLIEFKNSKGVATTFKSVESILSEYTGYDQPEQVKKFIQYAYDTWNITYVLLVGGLKNHIFAKDKDTRSAGWKAWWVPVRYVSIPHEDDEGCLSDLYYGCLYNATGVFDSWDSNGDGVYGAWGAVGVMKDKFDLYPEVYVGRLPVANTLELKHIVKKILTYERTGPSSKSWYATFVGVAGKTGEYYEGKPDGEYLCDLAYNYTKLAIPNLELVPVYTTNRGTGGLIPNREDISTAFNQGAGFVDFEGHGSPAKWDTIWFDGTYPEDWCGGLGIQDFWMIHNGEKQPIVVVGGCHNAMYNISLLPAMKDKSGASYFAYGYPVPFCFCWGLMIKPRGGAIASTGSTGYGIGYVGYAISLSAELETNFFYEIGHGSTHVAQAHSRAIQKFLVEEDIKQTEAFVITDWALLGDPSLLIGGYSS